MTGRILAFVVVLATVALIAVGTVWPFQSALVTAGVDSGADMLRPSSTPQAAVENLATQIGRRDWEKAYSSLANKNEFEEADFVRDLAGSYPSLRSHASLDSFDVRPQHASAEDAQVKLNLRWSTVVGTFLDSRMLRVVKTGDRWSVVWPVVQRTPRPTASHSGELSALGCDLSRRRR